MIYAVIIWSDTERYASATVKLKSGALYFLRAHHTPSSRHSSFESTIFLQAVRVQFWPPSVKLILSLSTFFHQERLHAIDHAIDNTSYDAQSCVPQGRLVWCTVFSGPPLRPLTRSFSNSSQTFPSRLALGVAFTLPAHGPEGNCHYSIANLTISTWITREVKSIVHMPDPQVVCNLS